MKLTDETLRLIYPKSTAENRSKYLPWLNEFMPAYGIDSFSRVAAFLAQIGHESGQLRYSEEIASGAAYEGRKSLGNVMKGDGVRFKGRGLIQITGRANYSAMSGKLGVDLVVNPQLLEGPELAVKSACCWWRDHKLNDLCSENTTEADFRKITKIINGGYNGWENRLKLWINAKKILKNDEQSNIDSVLRANGSISNAGGGCNLSA